MVFDLVMCYVYETIIAYDICNISNRLVSDTTVTSCILTIFTTNYNVYLGCANLLSRMLCVDVNYRITIEDLLTHDWITVDSQITRQPPIGKLYTQVPKTGVVSYMTTVFNFTEDDIFYSVMERKMNAVGATYHLLQKRFDAGILIGVSVSTPSPLKTQSSKRSAGGDTDGNDTVGLPVVSNEQTMISEGSTSASKTKLKSYIQLLKDSKLRSAQSTSIRSGYSLSRHNDFAHRRHKTRADIARYTKTREETGFLPDFILTYTQNENNDVYDPHTRKTEKFEWEQTFIISKKQTTRFDPSSSKQKQNESQQVNYGELVRNTEADGRSETDIALHAPPASPITPSITPYSKAIINVTIEPVAEVKQIDIPRIEIEDDTRSSTVEDPCHGECWSTFQRQKTQLSQVVSGLDHSTNKPSAYQFGRPITKPKTLTHREAKSYFNQIKTAQVIGQGRYGVLSISY